MSHKTKLDIISEKPGSPTAPKSESPIDKAVLEMIFGTPNSPKVEPAVNTVHYKANNREPHTDADVAPASQLLLKSESDPLKPPLAGPEVDDLGESPPALAPFPGIDDGLFEPIDKDAESGGDGSEHGSKEFPPLLDGGDEDGVPAVLDGEIENRFGEVPVGPDLNAYQQKKNLAQGMMDLALLSANANQLRYVLESSTHPYFYPSITFIVISIILQIAVGVGLILNSRYDVNEKDKNHDADMHHSVNDWTMVGVFLVTIVNVFITSFSVAPPAVPSVPHGS